MPIVIETPNPVPTPASPFPSLMTYRYMLADAAGFNVRTQTTSASTSANQVIVTDFQSTELEDTFLGNTWEYQPIGPNAGQVRRVGYHGLDPASGSVTLERAHTSPTPMGVPVEFYGRLPPIRYEGRLGLNDLVNRVLAECWTIQRLALPGVLDQREYHIGAVWPWLMAEDQIVEVRYRSLNQPPNAFDQLQINWRWVPGGDDPAIEITPLIDDQSILIVEAFVPMSWWINTGTGFGLATVEGLQADTDQAVLPIRGMEIIGAAWVFQELSKWGLPDDQAVFRQQRAQARAAANQWKRLTLEHPQRRVHHWPAVLTVRSKDNFGYGYTVLTPG